MSNTKQVYFFFFIILIASTTSLVCANAFGVGPASFELDLYEGASNVTMFYITADGIDGQVVVGLESLPFDVEPRKINITKDDIATPVELTFYSNATLDPGVYTGMVTFLASSSGFVNLGIKIYAKINFLELVIEDVAEPDLVVEEAAVVEHKRLKPYNDEVDGYEATLYPAFVVVGIAVGGAAVWLWRRNVV